jgi:small subunit ribosomal protein S24e
MFHTDTHPTRHSLTVALRNPFAVFRRIFGQLTMEIEIVDETENPMLHRTDVRFELTHEEATPSRLQVRDSLAATLDKDSDEVVIRKLDTKFGMRKTVGDAKVYESPDDARDVEQDHMLERNKIEADTEAEEAAADAE